MRLDNPTDGVDRAEIRRRDLLWMVTGAVVVGASGLLLPATIDEAAARAGRMDGALGGRRGKNRRGRDKRKRRQQDDRKQKTKALGAGAPLYKWVGIRGSTNLQGLGYGQTVDDIAADCYFRIKGEGYTYTSLKFEKTVSIRDSGEPFDGLVPGHGIQYYPDRYRAAIMLRSPSFSKPIFLEAGHDPGVFTTPFITVSTGGSVNASGEYTGGKSIGRFEPLEMDGCHATQSFDLDATLTYLMYPSQSYSLAIRFFRSCAGPVEDHKIFNFMLFPR